MAANNETGVVQPIDEILGFAKSKCLVSYRCNTSIWENSNKIQADFITSAHKFGGPKELVRWLSTKNSAIAQRWSTERESRAGTTNVPSIIGFGEAAKIAQNNLISNNLQIEIERICQKYGGRIIGDETSRLPNTTCVVFENVPRRYDCCLVGFAKYLHLNGFCL